MDKLKFIFWLGIFLISFISGFLNCFFGAILPSIYLLGIINLIVAGAVYYQLVLMVSGDKHKRKS